MLNFYTVHERFASFSLSVGIFRNVPEKKGVRFYALLRGEQSTFLQEQKELPQGHVFRSHAECNLPMMTFGWQKTDQTFTPGRLETHCCIFIACPFWDNFLLGSPSTHTTVL